MRKATIAGLTVFGVAVTAGVAYAALTGNVAVPTVEIGSAVSSGSNTCQNGTPVNFTWPDPTWNDANQQYEVTTLDYANITSGCVSLGTADLSVNVSSGGSTLASANATNMQATSGTLTLSSAVAFDAASSSTINFYVANQ